jgi:hypothetical protein
VQAAEIEPGVQELLEESVHQRRVDKTRSEPRQTRSTTSRLAPKVVTLEEVENEEEEEKKYYITNGIESE